MEDLTPIEMTEQEEAEWIARFEADKEAEEDARYCLMSER